MTALGIDTLRSGPNQEQWTSAYIEDQLLIDLCEKEQTLSADIVKELSREIFDSSLGVSILKYRAEFLRIAHRISASDYSYFPAFRIDPRDPSPRVLNEILAVDRKTQNMIMMDVIKRILRSNNKLLYLEHIQPNMEHIQPNTRRLSWKWEEFDFDARIAMAGDDKSILDSGNTNEVMTA